MYIVIICQSAGQMKIQNGEDDTVVDFGCNFYSHVAPHRSLTLSLTNTSPTRRPWPRAEPFRKFFLNAITTPGAILHCERWSTISVWHPAGWAKIMWIVKKRGVRNSAARCTRRQNLILILASILKILASISKILASILKILASIFFFVFFV